MLRERKILFFLFSFPFPFLILSCLFFSSSLSSPPFSFLPFPSLPFHCLPFPFPFSSPSLSLFFFSHSFLMFLLCYRPYSPVALQSRDKGEIESRCDFHNRVEVVQLVQMFQTLTYTQKNNSKTITFLIW